MSARLSVRNCRFSATVIGDARVETNVASVASASASFSSNAG